MWECTASHLSILIMVSAMFLRSAVFGPWVEPQTTAMANAKPRIFTSVAVPDLGFRTRKPQIPGICAYMLAQERKRLVLGCSVLRDSVESIPPDRNIMSGQARLTNSKRPHSYPAALQKPGSKYAVPLRMQIAEQGVHVKACTDRHANTRCWEPG